MKIAPPASESLNPYYLTFFKYLKSDDLFEGILLQSKETAEFLSNINEKEAAFRYAPDKWMLKEVVGHISDTERILSYRALRFARMDPTPLAAFDENKFIEAANFRDRTLSDIAAELDSVRLSTVSLYRSFTENMLDYEGVANNTTVSPRIILFFILVHQQHHLNIIAERYLSAIRQHS